VLRVPLAARKPSARWRSVPLDTKSCRFGLELSRYIMRDRGEPYYDIDDPEGSADAAKALFLNEDGKRWGPSGMQTYVRRLGADAGVAGAHVHRFRHTFGTWCARRGMNVAQIMIVGGWSSPYAASRYIKLTAADAVRFFRETND
jgi:integrase